MRAIIATASLLLITACGTQGPPGPSVPFDRSKVYCNTSTDTPIQRISNTWTAEAACTSTSDVPLSGDCYLLASPGISEFFYLSTTAPNRWTETGVPAGWFCTWSPMTGAPSSITPADFPGRAEVCCARP